MAWAQQSHRRGEAKPVGKAGVVAPAAADSERTLIVQRRRSSWPARTPVAGATAGRSAYFVDSASETSQAGSMTPENRNKREGVAAAVLKSPSPPTPAPVPPQHAVGGRLLNGIRDTNMMSSYHGAYNYRRGLGNGLGEGRMLRDGDDVKVSRRSKQEREPPVFFGSIRFPASRLALWNRRAAGRAVTVNPESAAPLLVLRQHTLDALAWKLSRLAAAEQSPHDRPPEQISLRWQGVLGPVANILPRGRTDDPRAATAPSRTALEILDLMEKDTLAHHAVIAGAGNGGGGGGSRWSSDKVQRQGQPVREARVGVLAVEGELVALGVEGGGWQQLGDEGPAAEACSEERYRALMGAYLEETAAPARSASPALFMPLRLHCSLKRDEMRKTASGGGRRLESKADTRTVTLSLRGEMILPALVIKLTPIAPLALLHTALYQSLLTRGAEDKPQSGLLTLNEGRRAVLLSDTDPLSLRVPIVGVWVSGGDGGGGGNSTATREQPHGPPPSPFQHPLTYSACLRYLRLLTTRAAQQRTGAAQDGARPAGGSADGGAAEMPTKAAPQTAFEEPYFLVLHVVGGVSGGAPRFFEGSATGSSDGSGSGSKTNSVASAGFEQLDFSADVDVVVAEERDTREGGAKMREGREGKVIGGSGGGRSLERVVVIGRLRRVSNSAFVEPFRRAQQQSLLSASTSVCMTSPRIDRVEQPARSYPATPRPQSGPPRTQQPTLVTSKMEPSGARWHVRHHATTSQDGATADSEEFRDHGEPNQPLQAPTPMAAPTKPTSLRADSASPSPTPSSRSKDKCSPAAASTSSAEDTSTNNVRGQSGADFGYHQAPSTPTTKPNQGGALRPSFDLQDASVNVVERTPPFRIDLASPSTCEQSYLRGGVPTEVGDENKPPDPPGSVERAEPTERHHDSSVASTVLPSAAAVAFSQKSPPPSSTARAVAGDAPTSPNDNTAGVGSAASGSGFTGSKQLDLDLRSLDPAARDLLLAQQRQLLSLEAQLRSLQSEMRENATAAAAAVAGQPPIHQETSPATRVFVGRATTRGKTTQLGELGEGAAAEGGTTVGRMVEASTNTSCVWTDALRLSADGNGCSGTERAGVEPDGNDSNDCFGNNSSTVASIARRNEGDFVIMQQQNQQQQQLPEVGNSPRLDNRQQQQARAPASPLRTPSPPTGRIRRRRRTATNIDNGDDTPPDRQPPVLRYPSNHGEEVSQNIADSAAIGGWEGLGSRAVGSLRNSSETGLPWGNCRGRKQGSDSRTDDGEDEGEEEKSAGFGGSDGDDGGGGSGLDECSFVTLPPSALLRVPGSPSGDGRASSGERDRGVSERAKASSHNVPAVEHDRRKRGCTAAAAAETAPSRGIPVASVGCAVVVEDTDSDDGSARAWSGTTHEQDREDDAEGMVRSADASSETAVGATAPVGGGGDERPGGFPSIADHRRSTTEKRRVAAPESADEARGEPGAAARRTRTHGRRRPQGRATRTPSCEDKTKREHHPYDADNIRNGKDGRSGRARRVGGESVDGYFTGSTGRHGGGSDGADRGYWRRMSSADGCRVVSASMSAAATSGVLPVTAITDLLVVPRIEFGQLTDDEADSDFDEGETIGRIESKYLRGGRL